MSVSKSCECGTDKSDYVYTKSSTKNKYPWLVMVSGGSIPCTGAIINDRYILTVAECINLATAQDIRISLRLKDLQSGIGEIVEDIIIHKGYTYDGLEHNIALLRLLHPLKPSQISPICLPNTRRSTKNLFLIAWANEEISESKVPLEQDKLCEDSYENLWSRSKVCASCSSLARESEAGAALVSRKDGRSFLLAILNYSTGFCDSKNRIVDMYESIYDHLHWIIENTSDATYCSHADY